MKSVLIIGLGQFGQQFAKKLYEMGNEVMGIDRDEERVNQSMPFLTNAQIGDATNEQFIEVLGVSDFDLCVMTIGDSFEDALQTTALLKDNGAKRVLARAKSDLYEKFLLRNGADSVVNTERDMAERLAMKYGSDSVFDYIQLTDDCNIVEIPTPAAWIGKTIEQKAVRQKHNVYILATKTGDEVHPMPRPDHLFTSEETLLIMGSDRDVERLVGR